MQAINLKIQMITKIMVSMSSSNHQAVEVTELNPVTENPLSTNQT